MHYAFYILYIYFVSCSDTLTVYDYAEC